MHNEYHRARLEGELGRRLDTDRPAQRLTYGPRASIGRLHRPCIRVAVAAPESWVGVRRARGRGTPTAQSPQESCDGALHPYSILCFSYRMIPRGRYFSLTPKLKFDSLRTVARNVQNIILPQQRGRLRYGTALTCSTYRTLTLHDSTIAGS